MERTSLEESIANHSALAVGSEPQEGAQDRSRDTTNIQEKVLEGGGSHVLNEVSSSNWHFGSRAGNNTFGSGVPDIPDWMIFGDFMMEHL